MKLYSYYRSSASYRVRIALGLKGLSAEVAPVNLLAGEQKSSAYTAVNPQQLLPALVLDDGCVLTQSLAIIEYLEEVFPTPALLPQTPRERARVRALALAVTGDIAPLGNSGTLSHLAGAFGATEAQKAAWAQHWMHKGLAALEVMLAGSAQTGRFCHGDRPGLADCCLVPQLYNARRFGCDTAAWPTLTRIGAACEDIGAFAAAHPQTQADAPGA